MPTSSSAITVQKKKVSPPTLAPNDAQKPSDSDRRPPAFLTIESALPGNELKPFRPPFRRSHSTLASTSNNVEGATAIPDQITLESHDGTVHVVRTQGARDTHPDRICLDRRGLTGFPTIPETNLRLLSLQHNLISNLEGLQHQNFAQLVFLDIYDNQLDQMVCLGTLENLRVLLLGKNRIKKIDGLESLNKIEVLDLHGNQIGQVGGLNSLSELKVLNLAGNQIRSINSGDFRDLGNLQELNLRRNKIRKVSLSDAPKLSKIFISNNDLHTVDDISSLVKAGGLREISIDNNPVFLGGDCTPFLVSYLPHLSRLNTMVVTEQVRKAAQAWRRNKESTSTAYMDLSSDICLNVRREEVISNARTNWELLRTQSKCFTTGNTSTLPLNQRQPLTADSDLITTSLGRRSKSFVGTKVPFLAPASVGKKVMLRTNSQESHSSSNTSSNEFVKLPPILVPILNKMKLKADSVKLSGSLSSIGPNVDSSVSSLASETSDSSESEAEEERKEVEEARDEKIPESNEDKTISTPPLPLPSTDPQQKPSSETASNISTATSASASTSSSLSNNRVTGSSDKDEDSTTGKLKKQTQSTRAACVKSATAKIAQSKIYSRRACTAKATAKSTTAPTAAPQQQASSAVAETTTTTTTKEREQGGDYLIEISGRHLNVFGQCALRFVDKPWNAAKANDVNTVKFNYVNFNHVTPVFGRLKARFPNVEHLHFQETNITCLGQLNALAEVQGLTSLVIEEEGNPITAKYWRGYAIYRLSHWGLSLINGREVTEEEIRVANEEYQSLSDMVLWSLPDVLLQPLLSRLRLDNVNSGGTSDAKKWLLTADPQLKSVVSKEALQWKRSSVTSQEDLVLRQKAKAHIGHLLEEVGHSVNKLRRLDREWPGIMHEFVKNALLDYSQLDMYMKKKISELK